MEDFRKQVLDRFKNTDSGGAGHLTKREIILLGIAEDVAKKSPPVPEKVPKFYRYDGRLYVYLDEIQVKHPVTREWYVGVLYADEFGNRYTRDITEFFTKFSEEHWFQKSKLE